MFEHRKSHATILNVANNNFRV